MIEINMSHNSNYSKDDVLVRTSCKGENKLEHLNY